MGKAQAAEQTELQTTTSALPAPLMEELMADAGAGHEEVRQADIQIPTLVVVQKMSPQLDKHHEAFIDGAEEGDIVDTLTGQLWPGSEGIECVCAHFRPVVNHVQPTSSGADFLGTYDVSDPFAQQATQRDDEGRWDLLPDGTALVQASWHFVLPTETMQPAVIRMKRSNMKASKRLNSLLESYQPLTLDDGTRKPRPRFAMVVRFETARQEKDGNVFYTWSPKIVGDADAGQYHTGRDLHAMIAEGRAVAAPESEAPGEEAAPF